MEYILIIVVGFLLVGFAYWLIDLYQNRNLEVDLINLRRKNRALAREIRTYLEMAWKEESTKQVELLHKIKKVDYEYVYQPEYYVVEKKYFKDFRLSDYIKLNNLNPGVLYFKEELMNWLSVVEKEGTSIEKVILVPSKRILINEEDKLIAIDDNLLNFQDITGFELRDNAVVLSSSYSSPKLSVTKTDTSSMVGRAIVGGVVGGTVGAAIGALSASKTTHEEESNMVSTSKDYHDYIIYIETNSFEDSSIMLRVDDNETVAKKLTSILKIVIDRVAL